METMQDYEIRCTAEQAIRAYKLGAPIKKIPIEELVENSIELSDINRGIIPTTQQMIGWLREEKKITFKFWNTGVRTTCSCQYQGLTIILEERVFNNQKEAELAAIDAALDYLEKGVI